MKQFSSAVRRWWDGVFVPHDNPPGSRLIFMGGYYKRHWTADAARASWAYFREHHRWIIGTVVIGTAAVIVAALHR